MMSNGVLWAISEEPERHVYVPDVEHGYALARVRDFGAETMLVEMRDTKKLVNVAYDAVFFAVDDLTKDVDDNCALMYLNEATLLHNCRLRYENGKIYTYVANILISINPYETIPDLYNDETIRAYEGKSLGTMPPHIFAIADRAYREMRRARVSQSIVVSGESGAGKTESQKFVLRYLCHCWGSASKLVEQRLLETNSILEAFGNAKTLRNNNSSRFGKFVEIHFNENYEMAGGFVSHYLLEKTRVCTQQCGERNFHVFYQLLTDEFAALKYHLSTNPKHYNSENWTLDAMVDDALDYRRLCASLLQVGFSEAEREELLALLAGILHLGNVEFDEKSDDSRSGTRVLPLADAELVYAADALGLDVSQLRLGLTSRMMQPTKGGVKGTLIMVPLRARDCVAARDALAKSLYSRLFDTIVGRINSSIPFQSLGPTSFIGILDIAGFEFFEMNSFEQFCINYCNEKLQQFFNDRILRQEQELYAQEGLDVAPINFADNLDCIELFEQKSTGFLDLLDEEARLPKPSAQHFTLTVHNVHRKHPRIDVPRRAIERRHRELRDDEAFLVRHYAATVCYETSAFLEKNNDALHDSLEMLLHESTNSLIKAFCAQRAAAAQIDVKPMARDVVSRKSGRLNVASVGCKFRAQLSLLLDKLTNTGTHFVRCLKPNSQMAAQNFDGAQILEQLKCAGMPSVLRLMHKGFPSRTSFSELYKMYEGLLPPRLARLDPRLFCKCLFHALGLNNSDFKFGMTKAFFRAGKFAEFDELMRGDAAGMRALVERVDAWICRFRWRKVQYGVWSCIKLINILKHRKAMLEKEREMREAAEREAAEREKAEREAAVAAYENAMECALREAPIAAEQVVEERECDVTHEAFEHANNDSDRTESGELEILEVPLALSTAKIARNLSAELKLADWTYAELRTVYNTSDDAELTNACREECHRRLAAYQKWRAANEASNH